MKRSHKLFLSLGGFAVLALLALVTPRAAHAVAAVLVQVTNTPSNPAAVQDADQATRIPFQSMASQNCGTGIALCVFTFSGARAGYRLVVENISAGFTLESGAPPAVAILYATLTSNAVWTFTSVAGQLLESPNSGFNQNIRAYFDPTDGDLRLQVAGDFLAGSSGQLATVTGYMVNCAVVACPAIQR